jgi:hypothetical protein
LGFAISISIIPNQDIDIDIDIDTNINIYHRLSFQQGWTFFLAWLDVVFSISECCFPHGWKLFSAWLKSAVEKLLVFRRTW